MSQAVSLSHHHHFCLLPRFLPSSPFRLIIPRQMGRSKNLQHLIDVLKDNAAIIKATCSRTNRRISVAILRASTHEAATSPPSDTRISTILSLCHASPPTACACITALMDRLHSTHSASVALKCLFTMHNIVTRGSITFKDQLSYYPEFGGRSAFRDKSDVKTWELSSWVRWYAGVLEQYIMVSRSLGYHLETCSKNKIKEDKEGKISRLLHSNLLEQIDVLVVFLERICEFPESLHLKKNELVYEAVRLVIQNYRSVQREIMIRVKELGGRIDELNLEELTQSLITFKRCVDCKGGLGLLFVNRGMNEALWDLINDTRMKLVESRKRIEGKRLAVATKKTKLAEPNRIPWNPFAEPGQLFWSLSPVQLTVATVG